MQFDPTTGMLDVSYAAAWTLGRQLALQDSAFSTALYNWKRGLQQSVVDAVESQILQEQFGEALALHQVPALQAIPGVAPSRALWHQAIQALAAAAKEKS